MSEGGHRFIVRFLTFQQTYIGKGSFFVYTGFNFLDLIDDFPNFPKDECGKIDTIAGIVLMVWGVFLVIIGAFYYLELSLKPIDPVDEKKINAESIDQPSEIKEKMKEKELYNQELTRKKAMEKEINELQAIKNKAGQYYQRGKTFLFGDKNNDNNTQQTNGNA